MSRALGSGARSPTGAVRGTCPDTLALTWLTQRDPNPGPCWPTDSHLAVPLRGSSRCYMMCRCRLLRIMGSRRLRSNSLRTGSANDRACLSARTTSGTESSPLGCSKGAKLNLATSHTSRPEVHGWSDQCVPRRRPWPRQPPETEAAPAPTGPRQHPEGRAPGET